MKKISNLEWHNVIILTFILFGQAIYFSTYYLYQNNILDNVSLNFTKSINYRAFMVQSILLIIAFLYLKYIKFDFSVWKIKISIKSILLGIGFFILVGFAMDIYFILVDLFFPKIFTDDIPEIVRNIDFSTVIYSCLNGFYEEIFFLGICMSVNKNERVKFFMYSLLIRFSFHTYQGLETAIGIGIIMGSIYNFLYSKSKDKNLFPYFLSHIIADILGLGVLRLF